MKIVNYSAKRPESGISSSYGHGLNQMKEYFLPLFLIMVLLGFINMPISLFKDFTTNFDFHSEPFHFDMTNGNPLLQFLGLFYSLLIVSVIKYGAALLYLKIARGEKFEISEIFIGFREKYLNIILANLLTFAIIALGLLCCIIPGIILACRLSFVPYLIMDKKVDPIEAVEQSWKMTKGHGWKIFFMAILASLIILGGLICFIIGVVIALMWIHIAFASLYYAVDSENIEPTEEIAAEEG